MQFAAPGVLNLLETGATVVVPSPFWAALVGHNYGLARLNVSSESWARPQILSVGAWLKAGWDQARYTGADLPLLLSGAQEHLLWHQIIESHTPGLFDYASTARLARRVARLVDEWNIPLESEAWQLHEDGQQFTLWLAAFRARCRQEGWTTESTLSRSASRWIGEVDTVIFTGFHKITPAFRGLLHALGTQAQFLETQAFPVRGAESVYAAADFTNELTLVARASRASIEDRSGVSVGVFVPNLHENRAVVGRIFDQIFYPAESVLRPGSTWQRSGSAFHINAPAPLSQNPLVAGTRLLLRLAAHRIPIGEAGAILRSPWIEGAIGERNLRAGVDLHLRRRRELDVTLNDMLYSARACPVMQRLLTSVRSVVRDHPTLAGFSVWSELFSDLLAALGWPGNIELDDAQRPAVEAWTVEGWKDKLSRLASLNLISERVSLEAALRRLDALLEEPGEEVGDFFSPVQILDYRQAHGLRFDRTFVTGLSDSQPPSRRNLSPLIPFQLQRAAGIPGATPDAAHEESRKLVADMFRTAPSIALTYSGRVLPAAEPYTSASEWNAPVWDGPTAVQSFDATDLELVTDTNAPPYTGDGKSLGGTGLLKDQSQCPFRAFAVRRLHAGSPEDGSFGMDPRERGGFVHAALESIWKELKTQDGLKSYLFLESLVEDSVRSAIRNQDSGPLRQQLSLAEIERLTEVILEWLALERERKIPFTVEITEQKRELHLAGLRLDVRIDRIDRLRGGKALLIDYKSGKVTANNLLGDRPKEPQLLAYASSMRDEVDGVFFGQLKPREIDLIGFAREPQLKGQKNRGDWYEFMDERLEVVERLAQSFVAGEAPVDPLKEACDFCDVKPFCRISELRAGRRENGDDD